jgi:microcompartment protein CcmK/EutM
MPPRIKKLLLAKVKGNVVSTQKNKYLVGHKLLIVHPVNLDEEFIGEKDIIALDLVDSGIGDLVLIVQEGSAVRQILKHNNAPVHSLIVAVVDDIEVSTNK